MSNLIPDWDPYDAILQLDHRLKQLTSAHNNLAKKYEEQGHVIDILTEGMTASNKANEILMKELLSNITDKLKEVK